MERAGVWGLQWARQVGPGQAGGLGMGPGAGPLAGCAEDGVKTLAAAGQGGARRLPRGAACRVRVLSASCSFQLRAHLSSEPMSLMFLCF